MQLQYYYLRPWVYQEELQREWSRSQVVCEFLAVGRSNEVMGQLVLIESFCLAVINFLS